MNLKYITLATATMALLLITLLAPAAQAAPLKLVVHEDSSADGEPLPPLSRFSALKRSLETALGRPVELSYTRDRQRVFDWMEKNQYDLFMTNAADLAAKALTSLGYEFVASGRPDVTALFIGKGAKVDNLKSLSGLAISLPRANTMYGQTCAAELRDFIGKQYTARTSSEYSAIVYAVENNLSSVGCIPSIARANETLAAKGIKVIYEGRPQPALPVIASPGLPAGDRALIAKVLTNYEEGGAGDAILKSLNVTGFTGGGEIRLRALTAWLTAK